MSKMIAVLFFVVALASSGVAQEICVDGTVCHTATADQVAAQSEDKLANNTAACRSARLEDSCTQAEYDTVCDDPQLSINQGFECGGETLYAATAAGTRAFFRDILAAFLERRAQSRNAQILAQGQGHLAGLDAAGVAAQCEAWGLTAECTEL